METYGVSLVHVDNSFIQEAIATKAHPDKIVRLKANVAFNCVYGFEYYEVPFDALSRLLCTDVGFNPFKFKPIETAIYDKEKHPNAYGLVRGVNNLNDTCNWVCFDIDVTSIADTDMHVILSGVNHHLARTSDPDKAYKYRVIVQLTEAIQVTKDEWKPFAQSLATSLGLGKIDGLAKSQVLFGYKGRKVLSVTNAKGVDPKPHLFTAKMIVAKRLEEEAQWATSPEENYELLQHPYTTFNFAYEAAVGDRWKTSMAAIAKAKKLGASKEYIKELMYAINDFLDTPKSRSIVEASLFSAI